MKILLQYMSSEYMSKKTNLFNYFKVLKYTYTI